MSKLGVVLLLSMLLTNIQNANAERYEKIPDAEVLLQLSSPESPARLPNLIQLLSWNVEKAGAKQRWNADFQNLASKHDLVFLQEGMADDFMPNKLREMPGFEWWMAQAWRDSKKHSTGVITGAHAKSENTWFLRSPSNEPIANTPKMTLAQLFETQNGKKLLAINTHGINFVLNRAFKAQMDQIFAFIDEGIANHPDLQVIFAGDFNTWNRGRLQYLTLNLSERGFVHAEFKNQVRNLILDHIFIRNCSIVDAQIMSGVRTSDHYPLRATIQCAE